MALWAATAAAADGRSAELEEAGAEARGLKAALPAVAVSIAEFSLLTPDAEDLYRRGHVTSDLKRMFHIPTHQLPMLTGRTPEDGAGDAARMGSAIFLAIRSIIRSEAELSAEKK
jgi:hypothetical protein